MPGPMKPPAVSSDLRNPMLAPRSSTGLRSATSASRGASRTPLPIRSTKRANSTQPTELARGKIGLLRAARP